MSKKSGARSKKKKDEVIVIAGEDRNDRDSLKILLEERRPELSGRIIQIRDPVRLHKAKENDLAGRVRAIVSKAEGVAERRGPGTRVACIYVHEDFDAVDGVSYHQARERVEQELHRQTGLGHYVLAVAEMEAWMLLFPEALPAVVKAWELPAKHKGKDTGKIADPKRVLMREASGTKGRKYTESDAPAIFRAIVEGGYLDKPHGTNRSWARFWQDVELCGREHLRR